MYLLYKCPLILFNPVSVHYQVFVLEQSHPQPQEVSLAEQANPFSISLEIPGISDKRSSILLRSSSLSFNIHFPPRINRLSESQSLILCGFQDPIFINSPTFF